MLASAAGDDGVSVFFTPYDYFHHYRGKVGANVHKTSNTN